MAVERTDVDKPTPMRTLLAVAVLAACALCVIYSALFGYFMVSMASCSIMEAAVWALIIMLLIVTLVGLADIPGFAILIFFGAVVTFTVSIMIWANKGYRLWRIAAYVLGAAVLIGLATALFAGLAGIHEKCSIGF